MLSVKTVCDCGDSLDTRHDSLLEVGGVRCAVLDRVAGLALLAFAIDSPYKAVLVLHGRDRAAFSIGYVRVQACGTLPRGTAG